MPGAGRAVEASPQHGPGHATAHVPQVTDIAVTSRHITSPVAVLLTVLLTPLSPLIAVSSLTAETSEGCPDSGARTVPQ